MPLKVEHVTDAEFIDDWEHGFGWIARPEEKMQRTSHAIIDDGVWLVDPLDAKNVDECIDAAGDVQGIILLLDQHERDAETFADRYDVPIYVPEWMNVSLDADVRHIEGQLPGTDWKLQTVVKSYLENEAALWNEETKTLIVADAVSTVDHFRASGERLGLHPLYRLRPPEQLANFEPERILCGHGEGLFTDAAVALKNTVKNGRRNIPSAYANAVRSML